jgi:hypothetical protein
VRARRRPPFPFAALVVALLLGLAGAGWWAAAGGGRAERATVDPSAGVIPTGSPAPDTDPDDDRAARGGGVAPEPRSSPSPRPTPKPGGSGTVPTGRLLVARGSSRVSGEGELARFLVEVEEGLPVSRRGFARKVESILFDGRSWGGAGSLALQRVGSGPVSFRVTLASPETTDRLCAPLLTNGIFSCYMDGRAVLNHRRWSAGSAAYAGDLTSYRIYMVNHEVGHALGHGHATCPGAGSPAPVMMQQTKGLDGCTTNPWPLAQERT